MDGTTQRAPIEGSASTAEAPPSAGPAPSLGDAGIALGFLVIMLVELVFDLGVEPPRPGAYAMALLMAAALLLRRRFPLSSYAVGSAALVVQAALFFIGQLYPYANLVHLSSAGLHAGRRRAVVAPVIGIAGVAGYFTAAHMYPRVLPVVVSGTWVIVWAASYGLARSREAMEVARRLQAREAASEERARIAREIHDLVGHTVNVMVVQAGAGRRILDRDPGRAREALTAIEETGRGALGQLDQLLGLLREDEAAALAPQPGLDDLPDLCAGLSAAGLEVTHHVEGERPAGMTRAVDVSAFRIISEALTNTLRHGHAGTASVRVRFEPDRVELEVTDDGRTAAGGYRPGRGLAGIAERSALFGGTSQHGVLPGGGFRVAATLPLPPP